MAWDAREGGFSCAVAFTRNRQGGPSAEQIETDDPQHPAPPGRRTRLTDTPSNTDPRNGRPQNATARTKSPQMPGRAIITGTTGDPSHKNETNE